MKFKSLSIMSLPYRDDEYVCYDCCDCCDCYDCYDCYDCCDHDGVYNETFCFICFILLLNIKLLNITLLI